MSGIIRLAVHSGAPGMAEVHYGFVPDGKTKTLDYGNAMNCIRMRYSGWLV